MVTSVLSGDAVGGTIESVVDGGSPLPNDTGDSGSTFRSTTNAGSEFVALVALKTSFRLGCMSSSGFEASMDPDFNC
jgi:hypothetical protein